MPEKVSTVTEALDAYPWHGLAACAGSDDPDAFFPEGGVSDREALRQPRALHAFLTCVGCSVRRECLAEALAVWAVPMGPGDGSAAQRIEVRAVGTWGGTNDRERRAVAGLPLVAAIEQLEAGLPARLQVRIEAFGARHSRGSQSRDVASVWAKLDAMGEQGQGGEAA